MYMQNARISSHDLLYKYIVEFSIPFFPVTHMLMRYPYTHDPDMITRVAYQNHHASNTLLCYLQTESWVLI